MHIEEKASAIAGLGFTEALNSLPDGAYITDRDRNIVFWNTAAERITGWPAREVVGRTCFDNVLCHTDQDGQRLCGYERCPLHRSIVTGETSAQPLLVFARTRGGERLAVEVTVSPLRDAQGEIVGGIETFRDASSGMDDLLRAQQIQRDLMGRVPEGDPRVTFCQHSEASELVGGDFFRVERIDDRRYALLLVDVRGHGLAAALYTMYLRSQWDGLREHWSHPASVMTAINRGVCALAPDAGYLATGLAMMFDALNGTLALTRAGHPAPVLLQADGRGRELGGNQPALGLMADTRYREECLSIGHRESVLAFSDGAVELLDAAGEEIGLAGLLESVPRTARGVPDLDAVPEQLLRRSQVIRQPDDLTLLSLTRH